MRRSPIKRRSPLSNKLSHARTKLVTVASAATSAAAEAVQHGTHLSGVVASRAGAKAEETREAMQELQSKIMSPDKNKGKGRGGERRSSAGIRDRINMFDSAGRSNVDLPHHHHRGGGDDGGRGGQYYTDYTKKGGKARRKDKEYSRDETAKSDCGMPSPIPPPCNPGYSEKENEPNHYHHHREDEQKQEQSAVGTGYYAFTSKEGVKLSPAFRRTKKNRKHHHSYHYQQQEEESTSPVNPNYCGSDKEKVMEPAMEESAVCNDRFKKYDMEMNDEMEAGFGYDDGNKHHKQTKKVAKDKHCHQQQQYPDHDEDDNMDISERNRAAAYASIMSTSNKNDSTKTTTATSSNHNHPYRSPSRNTKTTTTSTKRTNPEKHQKREHRLIQSPLRKHIKMVHDSAVSNATCTVSKDPFVLSIPGAAVVGGGQGSNSGSASGNNVQMTRSSALAAVANWDKPKENGMGHLDTLGMVMTGNVSKGSNGRNDDGMQSSSGDSISNNNNGSAQKKRRGGGEEAGEALDLLTSAAFLFKTSRRKLG